MGAEGGIQIGNRRSVADVNISFRTASAADVFGGDDPGDIVNRLAFGEGKTQIEQCLVARNRALG